MIAQLECHLARFADGSGYLAHDDPRILAMCARYAENKWTSPLEKEGQL